MRRYYLTRTPLNAPHPPPLTSPSFSGRRGLPPNSLCLRKTGLPSRTRLALSSGDCLLHWTDISLLRLFDIRQRPVVRLSGNISPSSRRARRLPPCSVLALLRTSGDCAPHASRGTSLLGSSHVTTDAVAPGKYQGIAERKGSAQIRIGAAQDNMNTDSNWPIVKNLTAENADWKHSACHRSGIASVAVKRKSGITRVPLGLAGSYSVFLWTFTTPFRWERSLWLFLAKSSLPSYSSTGGPRRPTAPLLVLKERTGRAAKARIARILL